MTFLRLSALCFLASTTFASAETKIGDLMLTDPFTRATLPNQPVGGGYLNIMNMGNTDDTLIAATSKVSALTEIHEMKMENDVMQMRALADGLPIPAGETVVLAPGGYHLMFMQLNTPFVEGETVTVTLTFENAGEVTLDLPIGAPNARAHGDTAHGGHSKDSH